MRPIKQQRSNRQGKARPLEKKSNRPSNSLSIKKNQGFLKSTAEPLVKRLCELSVVQSQIKVSSLACVLRFQETAKIRGRISLIEPESIGLRRRTKAPIHRTEI
jgi:hypothetical protein